MKLEHTNKHELIESLKIHSSVSEDHSWFNYEAVMSLVADLCIVLSIFALVFHSQSRADTLLVTIVTVKTRNAFSSVAQISVSIRSLERRGTSVLSGLITVCQWSPSFAIFTDYAPKDHIIPQNLAKLPP